MPFGPKEDIAGLNALMDFYKNLTVFTEELKRSAAEGFHLGMADALLGVARLVRQNPEIVEEIPDVAEDLRRRLRLCAKIFDRHGKTAKKGACLRAGRWLEARRTVTSSSK